MNNTKIKFCNICNIDTEHEQGNFQSKRINGELFHLQESMDESLGKLSSGFSKFVTEENNGLANRETIVDALCNNLESNIDEDSFFTPFSLSPKRIRSLKCSECGHLIRLSKLP